MQYLGSSEVARKVQKKSRISGYSATLGQEYKLVFSKVPEEFLELRGRSSDRSDNLTARLLSKITQCLPVKGRVHILPNEFAAIFGSSCYPK